MRYAHFAKICENAAKCQICGNHIFAFFSDMPTWQPWKVVIPQPWTQISRRNLVYKHIEKFLSNIVKPVLETAGLPTSGKGKWGDDSDEGQKFSPPSPATQKNNKRFAAFLVMQIKSF